MKTQDKVRINIQVGTEKLVLHINRDQEQFYRDAALILKTKLAERILYYPSEKEDIRMKWLSLDFAKEIELVMQAAGLKKQVKAELVERNAKVFVSDTRNLYEEKSPGSTASRILKFTLFHCAVELEKLKCTCCYCRKRSLNKDYLKENLCPKHPDGTLAGKHRSVYEGFKLNLGEK